MKKLLMLGAAVLGMAACSESSTAPSAPRGVAPGARAADITCRSGYMVAYDENGDPYCAPAGDGNGMRMQPPDSSSH